MRVCFWHSDKPRERLLADAFLDGVRAHGDEGEARALEGVPTVADCEVAVMVGVKSRGLFRAHWAAGTHILYMDKGYTRHAARSPVKLWEYWRTAVDAHQPLSSLAIDRPADRWERLGLELKPWRTEGRHVILAGSSQKYHDFYGLTEPTTYNTKVIRHLQRCTDRPIIYRPKPSWADAVPIDGSEFSTGGAIADVLEGAHALVTHGSNACFEAMLAGVPSLILGDAVAKTLSSESLENIETPYLASDAERRRWACSLAYCQWTMPEFHTGEAWQYLRPQFYR